MASIKITITTEDGELLELFTVESKQADVNAAAYEIRDLLERKFESAEQAA